MSISMNGVISRLVNGANTKLKKIEVVDGKVQEVDSNKLLADFYAENFTTEVVEKKVDVGNGKIEYTFFNNTQRAVESIREKKKIDSAQTTTSKQDTTSAKQGKGTNEKDKMKGSMKRVV